jgi:glucose/arabinose dehydrogenase/azurin
MNLMALPPTVPQDLAPASRGRAARAILRAIPFALGLALGNPIVEAATNPQLELRHGDHLAILGNALADRFQHSGHFETLVVARFPELDLVFRNLAVAGDELVTRHRSENFGSPDDWLKRVQADVVLAFFGFNESFGGPEGLSRFRPQLEQFIEHTRTQSYSVRGNPRLVLFSPIAAERQRDPNFPDPAPLNANLARYTAVMAEVARTKGVPFVDLFTPSQRLYGDAANAGLSLTVNGLHLTDEGDARLAPILFEGLFGEPPPPGDHRPLRDAVNAKNHAWHQRYRTVDGYNVYGGRSQLSFESGPGGPRVSNYHVMQEEMSQRDVLTANRDRRVWAVARGGDLEVDDANLPPTTPVASNKPGPNPDRTHVFLSGDEALARMTVHPGMQVNLFASETEFPALINPVQMAWDTRGRLWVAVWPNYPSRRPDSPRGDSLLVFEDTDRDGRADRCTPFLDDLNAPTGFQFYRDGVLVVQAPDVWWVRDTDGDGRGDWKQRLLMGLDSADSHHTANALCLDPGGAVYLSDGVFHRTQIETAEGPVRNNDAAIYRFVPRTGAFETYIPYGFANPHGRVFDRWGNDLVTDATGNENFFGPAFSGRLDYPAKHRGLRQFWARPSRPCAGTGLLSSRHFPEEFQGNFLNCNVISFQGIYRVGVSEEGSGLKGETLEHLVHSSDPNFRPVAVNTGPDGALYFLDWHNPIIGHMQHHLRDPNRDAAHGRIYRITYKDRPLLPPVAIVGQPIPVLLDLLKAPENLTRELAKLELDTRDSAAVLAAARRWVRELDPADPEYAHHLTEALWLHQWHNVLDWSLLARQLQSPEPRARAAATRVLCYWRDRVPDVLVLLRDQARDPHPRVRLEAVRAASFFRQAEAAEVALAILAQPTDYYLDYTLGETLRQLEPYWRRALADDAAFAADNPAGIRHLLAQLNSAELLELPPTDAVRMAVLGRAEIPDATRHVALVALAEGRGASPAARLVGLLEEAGTEAGGEAGGAASSVAATYARLLPLQPADALRPLRPRLLALAQHSPVAGLRPATWAALVAADGGPDSVWPETATEPERLADLLNGLPVLYDPELRATAYERVLALIAPPAANQPTVGSNPPASGANTTSASTVRQAAIRALVSMPRDTERTFATLAGLIARGNDVRAAAEGLRVLPRSAWSRDEAAAAATALVAWARSVPAEQRTAQDYVETVQLAEELAGVLPADARGALRRELRTLRVPVFVVRTVREQMRFDTPRLVVETGKPFEVVVENPDFMPHNFVVVKPGTRARIGALAEAMTPDQRDRQGRLYVPSSPDILGATRLLEAGQRQALKLTAPDAEGDHEFVCTFPNHWQTMWGWLIVTRDVDAYLERHPESAPAGIGTGTGTDAHAHAHHRH